MTLSLVINGVPYTDFTSIHISKSLDDMTGTFRFEVVDPISPTFPIKTGDSCTVSLSGTHIIEGFIDCISGHYSSGSHSLLIKGRDRTSDLVDSTVGGSLSFSSNISLKSLIEKTLDSLKIENIQVINEVKDLKPFSQEELDSIAVKPGKSAFHFLEMYARKRQVLLTTDNLGSIIITRNFDRTLDSHVINLLNNNSNNVLSARFSYDVSKRFNRYVFRSQQNPVSLVYTDGAETPHPTTAESMASQVNFVEDVDIREGRTLNIISESSSSKEILLKRAFWEGNIRRCRGLSYSPTLQGFFANSSGEIWKLNRLISVSDVFASIQAMMLINRIVFEQDLKSGSRTTLSLVDKDSYKVKLDFDKSSKRTNKVAVKYT